MEWGSTKQTGVEVDMGRLLPNRLVRSDRGQGCIKFLVAEHNSVEATTTNAS